MSFPVGNAKSQLRHLYNWDRIPNIVPASVFWHVSVRSGMYDDLPKCGNRMTAAKSSGLRLLDACALPTETFRDHLSGRDLAHDPGRSALGKNIAKKPLALLAFAFGIRSDEMVVAGATAIHSNQVKTRNLMRVGVPVRAQNPSAFAAAIE
jgi:hypothetical protein